MKRSIGQIVLLFIFVFLFLLSCRKQQVPTYYIPQQLKDYALFNLGSYWIYRNETTGIVDSSYLKFPPAFSYEHGGGYDTDPIIETCDIFYGGNFIFSSHLLPGEYGLDFKTWGSVCLKTGTYQPGKIYTINANVILKNIAFMDSINVKDKAYYNVLITQYQSNSLFGDTTRYTYFLAKSIGLIKCIKDVNKKDTTWYLLRYKIMQVVSD